MSSVVEVGRSAFDQEVRNSSVPVVVDFSASWCMPCRMLGPVMDEVAAEFEGEAKVVKVNVDENQSLAVEYGVRGIPALLFFNDGALVDRTVGVQPKEAITAKLRGLVEG